MNSIQRGYLYGARRDFTCCRNSSANPSEAACPAFNTTYATGLISWSSSHLPITAASSTAGWVMSAASTSTGET